MSRNVLDFSFMELPALEGLDTLPPATRDGDEEVLAVADNGGQRYDVRAVRLCNNSISDISTLYSSLGTVLLEPDNLRWLDLSFNNISIVGEALASFHNLSVLYLHSNDISKLMQIKSLEGLSDNLRSLTMHGNPVEEKKHYRNFVLYCLPNLHQLDFSGITKQQKQAAHTWSEVFRRKLGGESGDDGGFR